MNLYKVSLKFTIYVVAEDHNDAESIAEQSIDHEIPDTYAWKVTNKSKIAGEWRHSIPYGAEGDNTCEQEFDRLKETM